MFISGALLKLQQIFLLDNVLQVHQNSLVVPIRLIAQINTYTAFFFTFYLFSSYTGFISYHYKNTPIQIYRKFLLQKIKIFRYKNYIIFHISARNIDCWYSLEPPRRGGSNEYPQSMF